MIDRITANKMTARFGLSRARSVAPVGGGVINRSFLFELEDGTEWVCRVDGEDGRGKLGHEAAVYRWLWARAPGLPISSAYHVDSARDLIVYEYSLLPRLPGFNLGADIEHLPDVVRDGLLVQVGALLRRLHALPDPGGELIEAHHSDQAWRDYCREWFENLLARCEARLGYAPGWAKRARAWMAERIALLPESPARVFLHGDFHFGNLQYDVVPAPRLSGCFDLEWAWSGHATCDLLHLHEAAVRYPAYEEPVLRGYGASGWPWELVVYRLIQAIGVLGAAAVERPEPLWDLIAWHGAVIENVLTDRAPFTGLVPVKQ